MIRERNTSETQPDLFLKELLHDPKKLHEIIATNLHLLESEKECPWFYGGGTHSKGRSITLSLTENPYNIPLFQKLFKQKATFNNEKICYQKWLKESPKTFYQHSLLPTASEVDGEKIITMIDGKKLGSMVSDGKQLISGKINLFETKNKLMFLQVMQQIAKISQILAPHMEINDSLNNGYGFFFAPNPKDTQKTLFRVFDFSLYNPTKTTETSCFFGNDYKSGILDNYPLFSRESFPPTLLIQDQDLANIVENNQKLKTMWENKDTLNLSDWSTFFDSLASLYFQASARQELLTSAGNQQEIIENYKLHKSMEVTPKKNVAKFLLDVYEIPNITFEKILDLISEQTNHGKLLPNNIDFWNYIELAKSIRLFLARTLKISVGVASMILQNTDWNYIKDNINNRTHPTNF